MNDIDPPLADRDYHLADKAFQSRDFRVAVANGEPALTDTRDARITHDARATREARTTRDARATRDTRDARDAQLSVSDRGMPVSSDPRLSVIDARRAVTDIRLAVSRPPSTVTGTVPSSRRGATHPNTGQPPLGKRLSDMLRPHLGDAVEEIERQVSTYGLRAAQPLDPEYTQLVRQVIRATVAHFIDSLGQDEPDSGEVTALYARLGAEAARRGRSLDLLQTALRMSSQVACRRFIKDAYRFSWPKETLAKLTDHLFELLAGAADSGAQGYARQQGHMASDRERRRVRLRDLLIRDPAPAPDAIAEQARAAEWKVPGAVAVVALLPSARPPRRILPPDVLADWEAPTPYLIIPDPDAPGREWLSSLLLRLGAAAVGPTVPPTGAATSLRWARHTITLVERGFLTADRPVRSADHTALLAASMAEDLIDTAAPPLLLPLLALPARRRIPLLTTFLTYLQCGDNAVLTADRLHIHEQTVRYRLRRITELTGLPCQAPAERLDLMLTLTWLLHRDTAGE